MASDFCLSPTDHALQLTPSGALSTATYYTTCAGGNPLNMSLAETHSTTDQLAEGLAGLLSEDSPEACSSSLHLLQANATIRFMYSNLSWIESQLGCEPVQNQWVEVMNVAFCEDYYFALFICFSAVFLMSNLYFFYLMTATKILASLDNFKHAALIASINDQHSTHDQDYLALTVTSPANASHAMICAETDDEADEEGDENVNVDGDEENQTRSSPHIYFRSTNSPVLTHSTLPHISGQFPLQHPVPPTVPVEHITADAALQAKMSHHRSPMPTKSKSKSRTPSRDKSSDECPAKKTISFQEEVAEEKTYSE